jgi:hypothetical protein
MRFTLLLISALLLAEPSTFADSPDLAFEAVGGGHFDFDTGVLKGRLKLDGKYQGLYPLIDVETGTELVHPPGVFSFYRVLTTNRRYGKSARDWPTQTKLLSDGAVEVHWPPAEEHPLEMTAIYRWTAPDTLDLETTVQPQHDMPNFELFMSSYFGKGFRASVYLRPDDQELPHFASVDRTPDARGGFVMFPKDQGSLDMIRDGRWTIPPNAVNWDARQWLAAPVVIRRDAKLGLTAAMMCPSDDCFAVASPWNPATPEAGGYRSLYLSLFGRDLKADKTAKARCRLILSRNLSDDEAIRRYQQYVGDPTR